MLHFLYLLNFKRLASPREVQFSLGRGSKVFLRSLLRQMLVPEGRLQLLPRDPVKLFRDSNYRNHALGGLRYACAESKMPERSPTLEGFRAAFRRPSVTFAEIAWRWAVGALAAVSLVFAITEYLDSLPASRLDAVFLRTKQPLLVGRALAHIFRGTLNRAALAMILAALALSVLWMVAGSVGRLATVRALLNYFHTNFAAGNSLENDHEATPLRALIGLNFFRVVVTVAVAFALLASAIIARIASLDANPDPALFLFIFMPLAGLICVLWAELNWLLSVSGIFAVRDGEDALAAISAAATLLQTQPGAVFAVSACNAIMHLTAFAVASSFVFGWFLLVHTVSGRLIIAGDLLVTLLYFAVIDWLYIARLGGYIFIGLLPAPSASLTNDAVSHLPPDSDRTALNAQSGAVDRDEPILSDLPGLIPEC